MFQDILTGELVLICGSALLLLRYSTVGVWSPAEWRALNPIFFLAEH